MKRSTIANLALSVVSILVSLLALEGASYLIYVNRLEVLDSNLSGVLNEADPVLGYRARRNSSGIDEGYYRGVRQYRAQYTTNEFGRRIVPGIEKGTRSRFIALFGCSYTFGIAVNDDETMAAYLGRLAPDYEPYNFAYQGYGTQHLLLTMQEPIENEVQQETGIGLYTYIPDHTRRLIGSSNVVARWASVFPFYRLKGDELELVGSFGSARPGWVRFCKLANKSYLFSLLATLVPVYNDKTLDLTARVIAEARDVFERKFPGSPFYVTFHYASRYPHRHDPLIPYLDKYNLKYIRCDMLQDPLIPIDSLRVGFHHPSAKGHEMMAKCLVEQLGLAPSSGISSTQRVP